MFFFLNRSVNYAGKNAYSAGKTSGVLRGVASGTNRGMCWPTVPPPGSNSDIFDFQTFLRKVILQNNCKIIESKV